MNFPSPAYFMFFVDSGTENQLNILFVYMVVEDIKLSVRVLRVSQQTRSDFNT